MYIFKGTNMFYKTYSKIILLSTLTLFTACSTKISEQPNTEITKLGAKFHQRKFIPSNVPLVNISDIQINNNIVNQKDFLQQLAHIQNHSTNLMKHHVKTYNKLFTWLSHGGKIKDLKHYGVQIQQMRGQDGYQNVLMTGYYIPVIPARIRPEGEFHHPLYAIPKGNKKYSRAQIYRGALAGKGLELAYTNSMLENFLVEVQGSGFVDIGGGRLHHLAYGDKNGYAYTSIGRLLVEDGEIAKENISIQAIRKWSKENPHRLQSLLERNNSFVYFRRDPTLEVKGSARVPLVPLASVASDKRLIPTGSVLLIEMPILDHNGNWNGRHEFRLMVALDVGGAVKGQHFDLYQGIGHQAGQKAGHMKHYGRAWLLN